MRARVLDVGLADGIVDLSVRPDVLGEEATGKKKKKSKVSGSLLLSSVCGHLLAYLIEGIYFCLSVNRFQRRPPY